MTAPLVIDADDHPLDCEGCPDCRPFWLLDEEPIHWVEGFTTQNRRYDVSPGVSRLPSEVW